MTIGQATLTWQPQSLSQFGWCSPWRSTFYVGDCLPQRPTQRCKEPHLRQTERVKLPSHRQVGVLTSVVVYLSPHQDAMREKKDAAREGIAALRQAGMGLTANPYG